MKMESEMQPQIINQVSLFAGSIMVLFCTSTGIIALSDEYTGNAVKGILGLGFEVTKSMILIIVIVGGLGLIAAQYFIAKLTMQRTIKFNS